MIAETQDIIIKGACEHNLKNIDVVIPRHKITVVTGVSGSGKSSLVFDTILAEAQRRFFRTLSYYTRQFLDLSTRPHFQALKGLSPAIALAQHETQASSRANVGTFSDLAELLGVMFARFAKKHCPKHKLATEAFTEEEILNLVQEKFAGKLIAICAPVVEQKKGNFQTRLNNLAEKGYLKVFIDGAVVPLTPLPELAKEEKHTIKLVIDYVRVQDAQRNRLLRSMKLANTESQGFIECFISQKDGQLDFSSQQLFSSQGGCGECGFSWPELDSRYFAKNSLGRCPECDGMGFISDIEEEFVELDANTLEASCQDCNGTGLASKLTAITLNGYSLQDLSLMPIKDLCSFFQSLSNDKLVENPAFRRVLDEALSIAERINNAGLTYINLARRIKTLSGGEMGRLKLANILSETMRGVLYILDEPSQGLHPAEINELLANLVKLKELGNTVIIVDHDELIIRNADWVLDLGPGGGARGGELLASFKPSEAHLFSEKSPTAHFLTKPSTIPNKATIEAGQNFITLINAKLHNLAIPEVSFLRRAFNVVSGVSGAGKTSLVIHTLGPKISAAIDPKSTKQDKADIQGIEGLKHLSLIDRKPLAKSSVSMPITYLDAFTAVRQLFAQLPEAQIRGLDARSFSLHNEGGRCEECSGRGEKLVTMKFLPDARVRCESCQGRRYKDEILDLTFRGYSIADILDLTIDEACELFKYHKAIHKKLAPAVELGLGYLKLGQTTLSLSGGENQRLKITPYLSLSKIEDTILILDEPTRGLHVKDVQMLVASLRSLIQRGATIICVEHSCDMIRQADWLIELGPGAAAEGGKIIFAGPVSNLKNCKTSKIKVWL